MNYIQYQNKKKSTISLKDKLNDIGEYILIGVTGIGILTLIIAFIMFVRMFIQTW